MTINLRTRLLIQFLLIGIIPLSIGGFFSYYLASKSLEQAAFDKLKASEEIKVDAVTRYFNGIKNQLITFSENKMIVDAAKDFRNSFHDSVSDLTEEKINDMKKSLYSYYSGPFASEFRKNNDGADPNISKQFDELDPAAVYFQYHFISQNSHPLGSKHLLDSIGNQSFYDQTHAKVHPIIRNYLEKFNYYDIFIVDADTGHIIYSVFKELDFATSLMSGPYRQTNFAEVFRAAKASSDKAFTKLTDYEQYAPSYDAPASFIASPIYDGSKKIAVAIFQMPIDQINSIMSLRSGLGASGETILIGKDRRMRSNSFLDPEHLSVNNSFRKKNNLTGFVPAEKAIANESGQGKFTSYLGQEILASYSSIKLSGLEWALVAHRSVEDALAPAISLSYWMLGIGGITVLLNIFFGTIIGRNIANPILSTTESLSQNSAKVDEASSSLADSSRLLSELATQQASSIEETAASIEEISAMVKNNVEQAENSANLSEQVKSEADRGNKSMEKLIRSMEEIITSNSKIQDLVKVIGEIGEKTSIIDEIVFQTKLLSFNASVEAERAGEHGRGFAVVAQEVGNLAQMSGKAASEIASMVKSSIKNAEEITADNRTKVESGSQMVQETAQYLEVIRENAVQLSQQARQIVGSSKEQSEGISQVNEAMAQLDQATQQNSATAEETSQSSQDLTTQASNLRQNVHTLMVVLNRSEKEEGSIATTTTEESKRSDISNTRVKSQHANIVPLRKKENTVAHHLVGTHAVGGQLDKTNSSQDENWEKL